MLRWGILGTSRMAGEAVAPALRRLGHDLAVVASPSRSEAQAFAANQGARRARGAYEEVLAAEDVECVYLGLPAAQHEQWAVAAMEAGKHVLCEQPLSIDAAGGGRMAAVAGSCARVLMEALAWRFDPRTQGLLELTRTGELGDVVAVRAAFGVRLADPADLRARPDVGGGALLHLGSFAVGAARWLTGDEPYDVRAVATHRSAGFDNTTAALLVFPGGAVADLLMSIDTATIDSVDVLGSRSTASLRDTMSHADSSWPQLILDGSEVRTENGDATERMVEAFVRAVTQGRPPPLTVDDAIATADVVDRLRVPEA